MKDKNVLKGRAGYRRLLALILVVAMLISVVPLPIVSAATGAASNEPTLANGEFVVCVAQGNEWIEAGSLAFDRYQREQQLDLSSVVTADTVKVKIVQKGGGAAHLDSVLLGGIAPTTANGEAGILSSKLSEQDFDIVDVNESGIELTFSAGSHDNMLAITGRIDSAIISSTPFHFPLTNTYHEINENSAFYAYKLGSRSGTFNIGSMIDAVAATQPLVKEYIQPSSGHPAGYAYAWVMNDDKNLYVAFDFTSDNTMDEDKDYVKVYVKTSLGVKEFKISLLNTTWGNTFFRYTDKVAYQHKVYEFAVPLSELGAIEGGSDISIAFDAYGTVATLQRPAITYVTNPITANNVSAVTVEGTATPGDTIIVRFMDHDEYSFLAESTVTQSDGTFRISYNVSNLADGDVLVDAKAEDELGNYSYWSDCYEVTKNTSVPAQPSIDFVTNPINGNNQNAVEVTGTAEPGSTVLVKLTDEKYNGVTGAVSGSVTADAFGNYSIILNALGFADGMISVWALATNTAGESWWTKFGGTVIKDTVGPAVTSSDPGNENTGVPVDKTIIMTFDETIVADQITAGISLYDDTAEEDVAVNPTIDGKTLTIDPVADLAPGHNYTLAVLSYSAKDQAGNPIEDTWIEFTTAEAVASKTDTPTVEFVTNPINSNNQDSVEVTGTAEPYSRVILSFMDDMLLKATTADGSGEFSINGIDVSGLADGTLYVNAWITDTEGNNSAKTDAYNVLKDTVGPEILIDSPEDGSITNYRQPWLAYSVDGESEGSLKLTLVDPDGDDYLIDPNANYLDLDDDDLYDGEYTLAISATDENGNDSEASATFTVDTAGPYIIDNDPVDEEQNVPVTKTVSVTFNEAVQEMTYYPDSQQPVGNLVLESVFKTLEYSSLDNIRLTDESDAEVDSTKRINGRTLEIDPHDNLSYDTTYTVIVPDYSVEDLAGNEFRNDYYNQIGATYLNGSYSFSFKTEKAPAATPTPPSSGGGISVPSAPLNLRLVSNKDAIHLVWDPVKESIVNGYHVYRSVKGSNSAPVRLTDEPQKDVQFKDRSAAIGTTYIYYVVAADSNGRESLKSNTVEAALAAVKGAITISDIPHDAWYKDYVEKLLLKEVLDGYTNGAFRPNGKITRAEFAKMLVLAMGWQIKSPDKASFPDVKDSSWAYKYIETGVTNGVLHGYKEDGTFRPDRFISREEMAKIIAMTLSLPKADSTLKDIDTSWAKEFIKACAKDGIINGYPEDNTFKPKNHTTRAEAAAMIARMLKD